MSRDGPKKPTILHEPEQAIDNYLAALLSEVDEYRPEQERQTAEPKLRQAEIVEFPARQLTAAQNEPIGESPGQRLEAVVAEELHDVEPAIKVAPASADDINDRAMDPLPEWARQPFQCLLFKVRGMTLAIPLTALNSIAPWERETTPIPGQPDWHLGVYLHRDERVVVVDTAQLIMPERLSRQDSEQVRGSHILIIGDGRWGLACDSLQRPITLDRDSVRWSRLGSQRPWMAGTVIDKLCILLQVDALLDMIRHR